MKLNEDGEDSVCTGGSGSEGGETWHCSVRISKDICPAEAPYIHVRMNYDFLGLGVPYF